MVAAGVGITLLPMLAVTPPVPNSQSIKLLSFKHPPPTRRLAMVWRRSSAMGPLLRNLAVVLRDIPAQLLRPRTTAPTRKPAARKSARTRGFQCH
jgi:LysR family hydrogen peroxide-inducible transcriptional activator